MIVVVQRVSRAAVVVEGRTTGEIGRGLAVLVGIHRADTDRDLDWIADKLVGLRIFPDAGGKMNLSVCQLPAPADAGPGTTPTGPERQPTREQGGILLVPNFTLCAEAARGNRPSFTDAMHPDQSGPMFHRLVAAVEARGVRVARGEFGADMKFSLTNDGPVTIILDSRTRPGS